MDAIFTLSLCFTLGCWYPEKEVAGAVFLLSLCCAPECQVSPRGELVPASDALVFKAAIQGTPLDCWLLRPEGIVFTSSMRW